MGPKPASEIDSNSRDYQKYQTHTDKWFHLHPTGASNLFPLMNKLNKSKVTGLSARLFQECANFICIFNQSICQG